MKVIFPMLLCMLRGLLLLCLLTSCLALPDQSEDVDPTEQEQRNGDDDDDNDNGGDDDDDNDDNDDSTDAPTAPVVVIESPDDGGAYAKSQTFVFQGSVSDEKDAPESLALEWRSTVFGQLNTQPANSAGTADFVLSSLMAGAHTLTLSATDSDGLVGTDSIAFDVYDPNDLVADFSLEDVNPTSATYEDFISPRDYLGGISAWYFGHST